MRKCTKCGIKKPLSKFHRCKSNSLGRKNECAECANKYLRNHYHTKIKGTPKQKNKIRDYHYRTKYNISYEQYVEMCKVRNYQCDICGTIKKVAGQEARGSKDHLVLDHCHVSGKIRGILCQCCNQGLGLFRDNSDNLTEAHLYLLQTETDKSVDTKEV
jgi:hypothetical protein